MSKIFIFSLHLKMSVDLRERGLNDLKVLLNRIQLFTTPWIVACQTPLSTRLPRQEYWSELSYPPPGDLPNPGIKPTFPALQVDSLPLNQPGNVHIFLNSSL